MFLKKKKFIFSLSHFNKLTFIFKIFFSFTFLFIFIKILQLFSKKNFKLLKYKKNMSCKIFITPVSIMPNIY